MKTSFQFKYPPSSWHLTYRTIDDLCLSIRNFRQYSNSLHSSKSLEQSDDDTNILETTEESVIGALISMLEAELKKDFAKEIVRTKVRSATAALGTAPLSRANHFFYGILDLIHQHVQTVETFKYDRDVVELSMKVAEKTAHSFLRCKVFEILTAMISKPGIGQLPVKLVKKALEDNDWLDLKSRQKFHDQWFVMKRRAVDVEKIFAEIRSDSRNPIYWTSALESVDTSTYIAAYLGQQ